MARARGATAAQAHPAATGWLDAVLYCYVHVWVCVLQLVVHTSSLPDVLCEQVAALRLLHEKS